MLSLVLHTIPSVAAETLTAVGNCFAALLPKNCCGNTVQQSALPLIPLLFVLSNIYYNLHLLQCKRKHRILTLEFVLKQWDFLFDGTATTSQSVVPTHLATRLR